LLLYDLYKQKSPAPPGLFYAPTFLKNNTGSIKQTKNDFTHQVMRCSRFFVRKWRYATNQYSPKTIGRKSRNSGLLKSI